MNNKRQSLGFDPKETNLYWLADKKNEVISEAFFLWLREKHFKTIQPLWQKWLLEKHED